MKKHIPVLVDKMIEILSPKKDMFYIDATFGAGGYSKALLESADCKILSFDRDKSTQKFFNELSLNFPNKIKFFNSRFSLMKDFIIKEVSNGQSIDGIVFDLGVSMMQLTDEDRGFSFLHNGPLDMRMSTEENLINASVIVNSFYEKKIADIIFEYGDERLSQKIARAIVEARQKKTINTTHELAHIIRSVFPNNKYHRIDPATKTFQALRIFVNSELDELNRAIDVAAELVSPNGKIIIVSFHSLEDSIVKSKFRDLKHRGAFELINKKVIIPSFEEIKKNHSARSAKMRAIVKNMYK